MLLHRDSKFSKFISKGIFPYIWLAIASAFFAFLFSALVYKEILINRDFGVICAAAMIAIGVFGIGAKLLGRLDTRACVMMILLAGFVMRICYVGYTAISVREHDVQYFGFENLTNGHFGYIMTIVNSGKLPVTNDYQTYHPPLFHLICAALFKIGTEAGIAQKLMAEVLQAVPLFFNSASMLVMYKIINKFKLGDCVKLTVLAVAVIHPYNLLMAGMLNNDSLLWFCFLTAILYLIKWHQVHSMRNALVLAAALGLGMMTKFSAVLLAPIIGCVFVFDFIKAKRQRKNLVKQGALFLAVSVPLGMWYQIRAFILFGQPLGFVPSMRTDNILYKGNMPQIQRFLPDFSELFDGVFVQVTDYNVWVNLFKTSVFGETVYKGVSIPAIILMAANVILVALSLAGMFYILFSRKRDALRSLDLILAGIWIVMMISYTVFCIKFPYFSSSNFRYIFPTALIGCVFIGRMAERVKSVKFVFLTVGAVFVLSTAVLYSSNFIAG